MRLTLDGAVGHCQPAGRTANDHGQWYCHCDERSDEAISIR